MSIIGRFVERHPDGMVEEELSQNCWLSCLKALWKIVMDSVMVWFRMGRPSWVTTIIIFIIIITIVRKKISSSIIIAKCVTVRNLTNVLHRVRMQTQSISSWGRQGFSGIHDVKTSSLGCSTSQMDLWSLQSISPHHRSLHSRVPYAVTPRYASHP